MNKVIKNKALIKLIKNVRFIEIKSVLFLSVFISCSSFAQVRFSDQASFPVGWKEGVSAFSDFYQPILKPIVINLDSEKAVRSTDAWIVRGQNETFNLKLSAVNSSSARNAQIAVHELTHALHQLYRPQEELWVQEGVALLAEFLIFHSESALEKVAYESEEFSLIQGLKGEGNEHDLANAAFYGELRLFFKFMHRSCGGNSLLFKILTSSSSLQGLALLDSILKNSEDLSLPTYCKSFDDLFKEFEIRKFTQSTRRGIDLSPYRGFVSSSPKKELAPYSAHAYDRPAHSSCGAGEIVIDANTCLQVRMR